ncbi:hypothetical protein ACOMCU_01840 [Lysinibacillus sp. UGB7]|uniref:hypothetical protein n=1 Tax=Lysinibacillus sp. UGB7 TaxID=3411039 RepID=UPI003B7D07E7
MLNKKRIGVFVILLFSSMFFGCSEEKKEVFIDLNLEFVGKEKLVDFEGKGAYAYAVYKSPEENYYKMDISLFEYENWDTNQKQSIAVKINTEEQELFGDIYYNCIFNKKEIRLFEIDSIFVRHLVDD